MFSNILLASDGSKYARRAALAAVTLAKKFDALLTVLNVHPPSTFFEPSDETHDACQLGLIEMRQMDALKCAGSIADKMGVTYQSLRENGHPVERIVQTAENMNADLIVLGSRGLGDIQSFLLGSVSEGVMHHAHCPVLIVRAPDEFAEDEMFRSILLASDGSSCALKAAEAAGALAQKFTSRMTIVNVFQPPIYTDPYGGAIAWEYEGTYLADNQNEAVCAAERIVNRFGVSSLSRKEIGNTASVILDVAAQERTGLIVMGSRGVSGVQAFLLGSVSNRVAHYAHCPVLIVK